MRGVRQGECKIGIIVSRTNKKVREREGKPASVDIPLRSSPQISTVGSMLFPTNAFCVKPYTYNIVT